ncbi:hypothetical protein PTTG_27496 [Puccinia triticina 1-1 BBBD Race 1]|uniref:DUF6589 domain-containing protein n=1 Tax=Puccinia triticina (isolate 1-1 / race 1 (BBBD)) TaxID=630390 RepID=A0A180GJZ1_PUCT1|nr:hypothetical protein PTTG_27496 [Puccinia triticina 1-1 BBBD Race 1]
MDPDPTKTKEIRSQESKLYSICNLINELNLTPKQFLSAFLTSENMSMAFQRRYWGTKTGWPSTLSLLHMMRNVIYTHDGGKDHWESFILEEATRITISQRPPSGAFPQGAYHNTHTVLEDSFSSEEKEDQDKALTEIDMPFLFNLLFNKLDNPEDGDEKVPEPDFDVAALDPNNDLEADLPFNRNKRAYVVAKTICSMVAFVLNRRINGPQLRNSLTFLACGVTDRVNVFLQYIGLSSSRKTSHLALNYLSKKSQKKISKKISASLATNLAPFLCMDNLEFEQKIHAKSIGHTSRMFHGTWGYIHHPSQQLIDSVPSADLTVQAYHQAMSKVATFNVHPRMLLPSIQEEISWESVIKSQIAQALLEHLVSPSDSLVSIPTKPPPLEPISSQKPDITMLKLMIASDNSAQGAGEVFEAITDQSNMSPASFSSRLQVIDGDLGTCTKVSTLRNQRIPSGHSEESLVNVLTILGGAHTMWNISQAIYSKHIGDPSDARDSGSWRFLDSLGIPSNKMTNKKDYTLMIKNIEKIHRASLVYCIMVVMGTEHNNITEDLLKLPSAKIKEIIDETYERFFSPEAKEAANLHPSPKLLNLILRLGDFATIVEGNAAMKSGDIGRVMNVWKQWAIIAQGVKKLTQYSIQLPRMIILLNEVLPPGLGHGRQKHFVAKDHYLEMQNYLLKFFFNHAGRGTNIDRLKDLHGLIRDLTTDSGKQTIFQSHHNRINLQSLNNCMRMCRQNDICYTTFKIGELIPKGVDDFYAVGIKKMKKMFMKKGNGLNKLRPTPMNIWNSTSARDQQARDVNSDVSSAGDTEPEVTDDELISEEDSKDGDETDDNGDDSDGGGDN